MPIRALCSSCGKQYNLADTFQGKKVKCNHCGETFVAGAEEVLKPEVIEDEPAPRRAKASLAENRESVQAKEPPLPPPLRSKKRREDDEGSSRRRPARYDEDEEDDDRPRRRRGRQEAGNSKVVWILAGTTTGVIAVVVLLVILLSGGSKDPVPNPVDIAQNNPNPPNLNPNPVNQNPNPDPVKQNKKPPGVDQNPKPDPNAFNPFNPNNNPNPPVNPNPNPPVNPFPPQDPLPPLVQWNAQPDPGPDMSKPPVNPKGFAGLIGTPHVVFPSTSSLFVAVKHGQLGKQGWQIFNLNTFKPVAVLNAAPDISQEALSPDGKFLAGKGKFEPNATTINVVALDKAPRIIQAVQIDTQQSTLVLIDFLENGHLLTFKTKGLTGYYQVFNIQTGLEVKQFTTEGSLDRKNNLALSPGRKYLAIAHKDKVDIYQPLTGALVGQLRLPISKGGQFKGLAFSADGQELACYQENFGNSQLVCWKMTTGEQSMHHQFAKDLQSLVQNAFSYQGNTLEWVPDRSGFLFYGQLWVDYQSGAPVYKIPVDPKDFRIQPRHFVGKDHVVVTVGDFRVGQMGLMALPKDEIIAATKKARAEAGAPVADLPAATPADLAKARMLPAPNGVAPWMALLDPAPNPKGRLGAQPIALRSKAEDIQHIVFSQGNAGLAVVVERSTPNPLSPKKQFRADRYDLATGKLLGGCDLFPVEQPGNAPFGNNPTVKAEVSPEGSRLAVRQSKDEKRLDLWNLAEGKHLAGWEPFGPTKVDWFAFVDADRILTAGANGKLILWKVPECQALYVVDGYRGPLEFSPGRKYVLGLAGVNLEMIEAATGERVGQLGSPGGPVAGVLAAAFSRDGKEVVATIMMPGTTKIARWKLTDGTFAGSMNTVHGNQAMLWVSPAHVLHGNTLYDWNLKGGLWTYMLPGPGQHALGSPDGRAWFAYSFGANPTTILTAQSLPDAGAQNLAGQVAAGAAQPAVQPGAPVQLDITAGNDKFRTEVQATLEKNLQNQGFKVGQGGLRIAISAQESATGRNIEYRIMGFGPVKGPRNITVQEKQISCQAIITDAQGTTLLKQDNTFKTPFHITINGDDYERAFQDALWNSAINWGRFVPLPTNMFRINGQLLALPKIGPLVAGG